MQQKRTLWLKQMIKNNEETNKNIFTDLSRLALNINAVKLKQRNISLELKLLRI